MVLPNGQYSESRRLRIDEAFSTYRDDDKTGKMHGTPRQPCTQTRRRDKLTKRMTKERMIKLAVKLGLSGVPYDIHDDE